MADATDIPQTQLSATRRALRDALRVPGLVSLVRVVLAVVFPFLAAQPPIAMALLCAAGASDVLDGWLARRLDQVTPTGAALDGIADKLFVGTVIVSLLVVKRIAPIDALLLATREIAEMALVVWLALRHDLRERRANALGKATTLLQFTTIALAIVGIPSYRLFAIASAALGVAAAIAYGQRERRA